MSACRWKRGENQLLRRHGEDERRGFVLAIYSWVLCRRLTGERSGFAVEQMQFANEGLEKSDCEWMEFNAASLWQRVFLACPWSRLVNF